LAWQLVESSAIPLPAEKHPSDDPDSEFLDASEILKTALSLLIEVDVKKYEYVGLRNMRELEDNIKSKEMEFFAPFDDLPTAQFVLKSSMTSVMSSCVSEHIKELKYNQIMGFSEIGSKLERVEHQVTQVCCLVLISKLLIGVVV